MKYSFIAQHKKTWPVDLMCRVMGVKRNGFYRFLKQQTGSPRDPLPEDMLEAVREIAKASDYTYGTRRMKKALNILGFPISRNTARKLRKEANVQVRYRKKYKVTTNSNHRQPVFDNLLDRQFNPEKPD